MNRNPLQLNLVVRPSRRSSSYFSGGVAVVDFFIIISVTAKTMAAAAP